MSLYRQDIRNVVSFAAILFSTLTIQTDVSGHATTENQEKQFEVASVKANKTGELRYVIELPPGGRFHAVNAPLLVLIRYAFQIQEYQLVGAPGWLSSERFDVEAKASSPDVSSEDVRAMLQRALRDHFDLSFRRENRELPVFDLVAISAAATTRLKPSEAACGTAVAPRGDGPRGPGACGYIGPAAGASISSGSARMAIRGVTMDALATFLSGMVRRKVVNRSELAGYYDGEFDFTSEFGPPPPPPGTPDPYDRQSLPSIYTVLPEQLGLKLQTSKGAVEVLVIDRIERLRSEK